MRKFKRRVLPGTVFGIRIDSKRLCLGKVIYSSEIWKDVVQVGMSGSIIAEDETQVVDFATQFRSEFIGLFFTAATCIGDLWPIFGRVELLAGELALLGERRVGDQVWQGDRLLRQAVDEEIKKMPNMVVKGCGSAELFLRELLVKRKLI